MESELYKLMAQEHNVLLTASEQHNIRMACIKENIEFIKSLVNQYNKGLLNEAYYDKQIDSLVNDYLGSGVSST